jgi:hypothetical protein
MPRTALSHIALDLGITTAVAMFVAKPPTNLSGGVPLLAWCGFVVAEDLIDDTVKRPELGRLTVPGQRLRMGFRMCESMSNDAARVSELPGDLSDGQAIAMSPPNSPIVIHGNHVLSLRAGERSM